jgi:hypothetical protein
MPRQGNLVQLLDASMYPTLPLPRSREIHFAGYFELVGVHFESGAHSTILTRSPEIKFVMTTPTRGGSVKMVYAVPIVPLLMSLKPIKAGLIVFFCLYFGYLPVLIEFLKAVAQELGESLKDQ